MSLVTVKGFTLRDYQQQAVMDCAEYLADDSTFKKAICVLPTGAGKSLIISAVANLVDTPVLVLQPSKELLKQNFEKFINMGGEAGIFSASLKSKDIQHITFATPGSMVKAVDDLKKLRVKHVFIDECQLASKPGSQVSSIIKGLGDKIKVIGFTATPILLRNSLNGAELAMLNRTKDSIFSDIIHVTQIKQLVDKDYWAKLKYKVYKQGKSSLTENSNGSDFTDESIIQYYEDNRLEDKIVKLIDEDLCESRNSILIFVPSIEAAEKLSRIIPGSAYVHSKMDPSHRDIVIKNFKNGSIQVCINVNVLSVGFDHPALDCIIETAPTMSMARYYQKVGRAVRPHHSKEDALIIDFSGNYDRFGGVENLTFENLEGYGWGMFQGEYLLSGHPVKAKKLKKSQISKPLDKLVKQKIWFGIHKGSELIELPEDYIKWMLHQSGWDFKGEKMKDLKLGLEKILAM